MVIPGEAKERGLVGLDELCVLVLGGPPSCKRRRWILDLMLSRELQAEERHVTMIGWRLSGRRQEEGSQRWTKLQNPKI